MCACVSVRVRVCMCACAYVYSLARYIEGLQPRKRKRQEGKDRDVKQQKIPFMTIFFCGNCFGSCCFQSWVSKTWQAIIEKVERLCQAKKALSWINVFRKTENQMSALVRQ